MLNFFPSLITEGTCMKTGSLFPKDGPLDAYCGCFYTMVTS